MALILRILGGLVRIAALGLALACAAGALGGQAARVRPALDMLNHFEPAWLVGAMAAGLLGWRDRVTVAVAAVAVIACALQIAPELVADVQGARPLAGAERLKLVQFNAWVHNRDPQGSARWILAEDPDIVVIEEAYDSSVPLVRALRGRYPYLSNCGGGCSVGILSKTAPIASGRFGVGDFAWWASFAGRGGPYIVVGEHATHPWPPQQQATDFEVLADGVRGLPQARMVLAGDFNSTPWSFALKRLDRSLPLVRRDRAIATWPSAPTEAQGRKVPLGLPVLPIDHVYAGPGWRTLDVRRGPSLGSDHRPIVVTLQAAP